MNMKQKQQGFSLFLVMILMLVIALLVIVTSQSANTELRMSSNEADRKYAVSVADTGLRAAEAQIQKWVEGGISSTEKFTGNCTNGQCSPADGTYQNAKNTSVKFIIADTSSKINAWERCADNPANTSTDSCQGKTVLDEDCVAKKRCLSSGGARYIIEFLGTRQDSTDQSEYDFFRITSRAHGQNADTTATLQTYVELHYDPTK